MAIWDYFLIRGASRAKFCPRYTHIQAVVNILKVLTTTKAFMSARNWATKCLQLVVHGTTVGFKARTACRTVPEMPKGISFTFTSHTSGILCDKQVLFLHLWKFVSLDWTTWAEFSFKEACSGLDWLGRKALTAVPGSWRALPRLEGMFQKIRSQIQKLTRIHKKKLLFWQERGKDGIKISVLPTGFSQSYFARAKCTLIAII